MSDWIVPVGENSLNLKKSQPTRIVIAESHPIFRDGLRRLLETEPDLKVIGEACDGAEGLRLAQELKPDILLLDMAMRKHPGWEALRHLNADLTPTPVRLILLTVEAGASQIVEAMGVGREGSRSKKFCYSNAAESNPHCDVWRVLGRERVSNLVQYYRKLAKSFPPRRMKFGLTPRERLIAVAVAEGYSDKGIADLLNVDQQEVRHHIGEDTIRRHLANIFDKLGLSTRGELALYAVKNLKGGCSSGSVDPDAPVRVPLTPKAHMRSGGVMAVPEQDDPEQILPEMKLAEGEKTCRARTQLEVNMRERERERLARRDAYEWELQHCGKKRKLR